MYICILWIKKIIYKHTWKLFLGIASGSSIDWARQELGIKYCYNFALPGPDVGFLLPENEIENAGKELLEAIKGISLVARNFSNNEIPEFLDVPKDI